MNFLSRMWFFVCQCLGVCEYPPKMMTSFMNSPQWDHSTLSLDIPINYGNWLALIWTASNVKHIHIVWLSLNHMNRLSSAIFQCKLVRPVCKTCPILHFYMICSIRDTCSKPMMPILTQPLTILAFINIYCLMFLTIQTLYFLWAFLLVARSSNESRAFSVVKFLLQKTAFSLIKSRLALGSPGWFVFVCHHVENW